MGKPFNIVLFSLINALRLRWNLTVISYIAQMVEVYAIVLKIQGSGSAGYA